MKRERLNEKDIADVLLEFLEPLVHHVLYVRGVYPESLFEKVTVYGGTPSFRSRHPQLNAYIQEAVLDLKPWLQKQSVQRFNIVIYTDDDNHSLQENNRIESFTFKLDFPTVESQAADLDALIQFFRDCFFQVSMSSRYLKQRVPEGSTFQIEILTTSEDPSRWVGVDAAGAGSMGQIYPLKSLKGVKDCKAELFIKRYFKPYK